jgi:hypothetical protein
VKSGRLRKMAAALTCAASGRPASVLELLLTFFPRRPRVAAVGFTREGCVMSLAGSGGDLRFFDSLICGVKLQRNAEAQVLARRRLLSFPDLCAALNNRFKMGLDQAFASWLAAELLRAPGAPGWPMFGARVSSGGRASVTMYLVDKPWAAGSGWLNIGPLLSGFGLTAAGMSRCLLRGRFDCAGVTLGPGGSRTLKIYTRFPPPPASGFGFFRRLHGEAGGGVLAACLHPPVGRGVRHWTNAYRFGCGLPRPVSVKTEVHFRKPIPAAALFGHFAGTAAEAPLCLLAPLDCAVSTLAVEGGKVTVYFPV